MYELKCKREGCNFNKNCRCSAKKITIKKSAICESYTPSESYNKEEKSKISQKAVRTNTLVNCHATGCLFNTDGICTANGITVATNTPSNMPECFTIKAK